MDVDTAASVFHEVGHAANALLSRTFYHHAAGTRTSIDSWVAERPREVGGEKKKKKKKR
jgi:Zn-dependent oligopeptidase